MKHHKVRLITKIWFAIAMFFWRLARKSSTDKQIVGLPFQRDPDNKCDGYEPFKSSHRNFYNGCESDGHYLCRKCVHLEEEKQIND